MRVRAEGQDFSAQLAEELDIFQRRGGLADLPAQAGGVDLQPQMLLGQGGEDLADHLVIAAHLHRLLILADDVPQRVGHVRQRVKAAPLAQLQQLVKVPLEDDLGVEPRKIDVGKVVHPADGVQRAEHKVEAVFAQHLLGLIQVLGGLPHLDAVHHQQPVVEGLPGFAGLDEGIAQAQVGLLGV